MSNVADPPTCPNCHKPMTLKRVVPKVATLPEIETFRCDNCGEVLSKIKNGK